LANNSNLLGDGGVLLDTPAFEIDNRRDCHRYLGLLPARAQPIPGRASSAVLLEASTAVRGRRSRRRVRLGRRRA
jgi:hypothetical protein